MINKENNTISVEAIVEAPIQTVWELWTQPEHIMQWNNASDDWHTPHAENNLVVGGKFLSRMAAKDGSFSFDFSGTYDAVNHHSLIAYSLGDSRKVKIQFESFGDKTKITEVFDPENQNSLELQEQGWQSILNNFKKYVESKR